MIERPWGGYEVVYADRNTWTKILYVAPGHSLSFQTHKLRDELWLPLDEGAAARIGWAPTFPLVVGKKYHVAAEVPHRIINKSTQKVRILEIATGYPSESDIVRLQDDYGRTNE